MCVFFFKGYSQGGLVSRALLEKNPDHNVQTFISLSSPQAGQYGSKQNLYIFFNFNKESLLNVLEVQQNNIIHAYKKAKQKYRVLISILNFF
jgi:Palmitoyl protein thioesterase